MANSLVKLTLESNQYERNLRQAQKSWNEFTKGIGMSMSKFTAVGAAIGAVTGALKVAKDAFKSSETSLDEWGRTVQSTQSLYQGFLSALNNADISGFLGRMDDIVSAAREAYNAMDELGTFNAFQQRNVAKGRAGYAQALDEYRLNPTADNKQRLQQANQKVMNDLRDSHDKTEAAYQAALRQIATERLSGKGLQDAFVKMFSEGNYGDLQTAKASYKTGRGLNSGAQYYYGDRVYDGRVQDRATGKWRDMSDTEKQQFEFARALSQVNDSQIKEVQALGAQSIAITEQIYQQDRAYNRLAGNNAPLNGGRSGRSGGSGGSRGTKTEPTYAADSIAAQQKLVADLTKQWNEAGASVRNQYIQPLVEAEAKLKAMTDEQTLLKEQASGRLKGNAPGGNGIEIPVSSDASFESWLTDIQAQLANLEFEPIEIPIETTTNDVKAIAEAARTTADVVGSIGDAFNAIEDPAAKVMGTVMDAIANVALGYAQATVAAAQTGNPWVWAAFAVSGLATMITMISNIHSATGYAEGGIVKGNHYSGDMMDGGSFGINAGELVLNKAQQNSLASELSSGEGRTLRVVGKISGTDILLSADRSLRLQGKELAVWGRG